MMKKYIVGAIFGFLLAITTSVYANDVVSMIGKKVEGSFPLQVNGVRAEKDVVVIEGTSYLPVRSAGKLFGYDVSFIDSQVILKPIDGVVNLDKLQQINEANDPGKQAIKEKIDQDKLDNAAEIQAQADAEAERQATRKAEIDALKKAADESNITSSPTPTPTPTP